MYSCLIVQRYILNSSKVQLIKDNKLPGVQDNMLRAGAKLKEHSVKKYAHVRIRRNKACDQP